MSIHDYCQEKRIMWVLVEIFTSKRGYLYVIRQEPLFHYVELLVNQLQKLTTHYFIAKAQANEASKSKDNERKPGPWNSSFFQEILLRTISFVSRTRIPLEQYARVTASSCNITVEVINNKSYCILSDYLNHGVSFVYKVQELVLNDIKSELPQVKNIENFSDTKTFPIHATIREWFWAKC